MVKVLRFIEQRINAMIEIWGVQDTDLRIDPLERLAQAGDLLDGDGDGVIQVDIDAVLTHGGTGTETAQESVMAVTATAAPTTGFGSRPASERGLAGLQRTALARSGGRNAEIRAAGADAARQTPRDQGEALFD